MYAVVRLSRSPNWKMLNCNNKNALCYEIEGKKQRGIYKKQAMTTLNGSNVDSAFEVFHDILQLCENLVKPAQPYNPMLKVVDLMQRFCLARKKSRFMFIT